MSAQVKIKKVAGCDDCDYRGGMCPECYWDAVEEARQG